MSGFIFHQGIEFYIHRLFTNFTMQSFFYTMRLSNRIKETISNMYISVYLGFGDPACSWVRGLSSGDGALAADEAGEVAAPLGAEDPEPPNGGVEDPGGSAAAAGGLSPMADVVGACISTCIAPPGDDSDTIRWRWGGGHRRRGVCKLVRRDGRGHRSGLSCWCSWRHRSWGRSVWKDTQIRPESCVDCSPACDIVSVPSSKSLEISPLDTWPSTDSPL
jgi:hypothetical protein